MKGDLLIAEAMRSQWAIEPAYGQQVASVLARWARGEPPTEADLKLAAATRDGRAGRQTGNRGSIAVIPLYGTIVPKAGLITQYSGGTSCQAFSAALRELVADETVSQVLIDIDSPGGSVSGVQELASEIMQLRNEKPIIAISNHQAASAAYWLGSCATEFYCSPSGEVGSIGVFTMHQDLSEALAKEGVKNTMISAGKYKTELSPYAPLSIDAKDYLQAQVNEHYRAFAAAVARGRGVSVDRVRTGFGQGRMLTAQSAFTEGMVDGVMSFADLVRDLAAKPRSARGPRSSRIGASLLGNTPVAVAARRRQRELELLELGG